MVDKHVEIEKVPRRFTSAAGRYRLPRWVSVLWPVIARALLAAVVLWLAASLPLPIITSQLFVMVRIPIAIFLFIVYIGKLLIDTFFYPRYP